VEICEEVLKAIFFVKLLHITDLLGLADNVRRYVHVGAESRWRVFLHSWCDAGLSGYYLIVALAKTVTPGGSPRREPGQAAPPTT